VRIIGPPSVPVEIVFERMLGMKVEQRFRDDAVPELWDAAERYRIDPVGLVAQALKETGLGRFGGKVKFEFYNPCGLKTRHPDLFPGVTDGDNPLAHAMFPNWRVGALAHGQHVIAYAGWPELVTDLGDPIVDPRWDYVAGRHRLEDWAELGGKWAPSTTYGVEIEALMRRLGSP
jgi:N-acetylmuramoyl-L-alanine amidase